MVKRKTVPDVYGVVMGAAIAILIGFVLYTFVAGLHMSAPKMECNTMWHPWLAAGLGAATLVAILLALWNGFPQKEIEVDVSVPEMRVVDRKTPPAEADDRPAGEPWWPGAEP